MLLKVFSIPFRLTAVCLVILFTIVTRFAQFAVDFEYFNAMTVLNVGLVAPLLWSALSTLSFYSKKWLVHIQRGLVFEFMDSEAELNPFMSRMPAKLGALMFVVGGVWLWHGAEPSIVLLIPAVLGTFMWLGLMLEDSALRGLHPMQIWQTTVGAGYLFPVIFLLIAGGIGQLLYVALWVPNILLIALSAFAFLLSQSLVGLVLYYRRTELILYTIESPEQAIARAAIAQAHAVDDFLVHLAELCARRQFGTAYSKLTDYLGDEQARLDPVVHERLSQFSYPQLYLEHAVHYLHRLYDSGDERKAWALLRECIERDDHFRPMDDATMLALTRFADAQDAGLVEHLLADFERAYPDSKIVPDALFRQARVLIERLNYQDRGIAVLIRIVAEFGEFQAIADVKRYLAKIAAEEAVVKRSIKSPQRAGSGHAYSRIEHRRDQQDGEASSIKDCCKAASEFWPKWPRQDGQDNIDPQQKLVDFGPKEPSSCRVKKHMDVRVWSAAEARGRGTRGKVLKRVFLQPPLQPRSWLAETAHK